MLQYFQMVADIVVSSKDGREIKAITFRKRIRFSDDEKLLRKVQSDEVLRLDLMAIRILGNQFLVEHLVDANDIDLFSLLETDQMRFPNPDIIGTI